MSQLAPNESPDYLIIGHLARDLTYEGPALGGTAAYAGLTAHALGLTVGVVTSTGPGIDLRPLAQLAIQSLPAEQSTTFANRYAGSDREQVIMAQALPLGLSAVPLEWRRARIVHLGPIADEVDPELIEQFPSSFIGATPQGWLRTWDAEGHVGPSPLGRAARLLPSAGAVVLSIEDVGGEEEVVESLARLCRLLVVTEAHRGARVHWRGEHRWLPAPEVTQVDPTGSGDIFAASFFTRLMQTQDPWEAARFANSLAAMSVTRSGIESIPRQQEIEAAYSLVRP